MEQQTGVAERSVRALERIAEAAEGMLKQLKRIADKYCGDEVVGIAPIPGKPTG